MDNFVDDNDDFDFSSAYMPTSLLLKSQQDTADKTTTSSSDEAAATAVAISDSDLLVQSETTVDTVAEDIETLEFEEDSDEEDESTQAEGFNLREVLAMMNMLGAGKHEQDRMQSIALALQQGLSYAEMQFDSNGNDDNGEVRYFTDVEEFAVEEEADEVVVLHHNNNAENMP